MTGIQSGHRQGVAEVYNQLYHDRLTSEILGTFSLATDNYQIFQVIIQNVMGPVVTVGKSKQMKCRV